LGRRRIDTIGIKDDKGWVRERHTKNDPYVDINEKY
jgi:hypothetical protein